MLELAGPPIGIRLELFDFIVAELQQRECKEHPKIGTLRTSLRHQRDALLAFAGVLDQKLAEIAVCFKMPLQKVRDVCLLYRKHLTSNTYWERWNQLHSELSGKLHLLMEAVGEALNQTPQSQFVGGESELSITELLFPQEAARPFLFESTAVLSQSPLLYAQRSTGTRG